MARVILAGDVGGTKTHLGLYQSAGGALEPVRDRVYATTNFKSLEAICADFLGAPPPRIDAACFGVPGPIIDGRADPVNIPWTISAAKLSRKLGGAPVRLLNDLCATAYGAIHLPPSEVAVIHPAKNPPAHGNIAVLAAGTGLGESALVWEEGRYYAVASEGGHCDFAPRGEEQIGLLRHLAEKFGHVSYERILSGPGIVNLYRFLRERDGGSEAAWLGEQIAAGDPAAAISAAAIAGRDAVCVHTMTLFCDIYGSEAAKLALKVFAIGGVYLGGGIAPKILPMLRAGAFVNGFMAKGRLDGILSRIEVRVALNPAAALLGAAYCATGIL